MCLTWALFAARLSLFSITFELLCRSDVLPDEDGEQRCKGARFSVEYSDEWLAARWAAGDQAACAALVDRYYQPLLNLFYRLTGSRSEAEDLVQETWLRALRSLRAPRDVSVKPWLYRIATNLWRDAARKQIRRRESGHESTPLETEAPIRAPDDRKERICMANEKREDPFDAVAALLDSLPPLEADQRKAAALVARLAAATESQPAPPAQDDESRLFWGLCGGFATVATLLGVSIRYEVPIFPGWMLALAGLAGVASIVVLGALVIQRRMTARG